MIFLMMCEFDISYFAIFQLHVGIFALLNCRCKYIVGDAEWMTYFIFKCSVVTDDFGDGTR